MKLLETWVEHPTLHGTETLILTKFLSTVWPELAQSFTKGRIVPTICPEAEMSSHVVGKLASMIRSSSPQEITVLTVGGSPRCFLLHVLVNKSIYMASAHGIAIAPWAVLEQRVAKGVRSEYSDSGGQSGKD